VIKTNTENIILKGKIKEWCNKNTDKVVWEKGKEHIRLRY
jgi:hypothetical protein